MTVNFLLVGNGAREHAIAKSLCKSPDVRLFACMSAKNPGIANLCQTSKGEFKIGNIENGREIAKWAKDKKIALAFPSPDAVLAAGVADELKKARIRICAPLKAAARVEWDKNFLRHLMVKYKIEGCPKYKHFTDEKGIDEFIDQLKEVAVKPVGLTGGKGVSVSGFQLKNSQEAKAYAKELLAKKTGGSGGVVIEEKLLGEEFTLMAFCDGKTMSGMRTVQDHKRAFEDDLGPNTGGMGAYCDNNHILPFLKQEDYDKSFDIMHRIMEALERESGEKYVGVMYGQFMATHGGVSVIEINARFGDPEAMNALAVLKTPLLDIFNAMADGTLADVKMEREAATTVVKYVVPEGYPNKAVEPFPIGIDYACLKKSGAEIFFASVDERDGQIFSGMSRAIAVLGKGASIAQAQVVAEEGCGCIFGRLWHRRDIGTPNLVQKRIEHMQKIRREH